MTYVKWSVQANVHTHTCNEVKLVLGLTQARPNDYEEPTCFTRHLVDYMLDVL